MPKTTEKRGWIGVDLDGTLAKYDSWKGEDHIGDPIPAMLFRVKQWVSRGVRVKIMTARYHNGPRQIELIQDWLEKHDLPRLEVTATKDFKMIRLWDDRAIQVEENTGRRLDGGNNDPY